MMTETGRADRPTCFSARSRLILFAMWRLMAIGLGVAVPSVAHAGNGLHPRTPVIWPAETACMTIVDRTEDPVLHLDYEIPYEDPLSPEDVSEDEVEDSRTHQFLAFCRQAHLFEVEAGMPNFVSVADSEAAIMNELVDPAKITVESILETSEVWADCWHRIIADEDRRPIFFEYAEQGVEWDTTGLPIGTYTVQGFTHEPAFNRYWQRPGVVKVIDGDADAAGPAGAIANEQELVFAGCPALAHGCLDAPLGTTATLSYASTRDREDGTWVPEYIDLVGDVAVNGDSWEIEFIAPAEEAGLTILLKVDFTDPSGKTFAAHMTEEFIVLAGTDPTCGAGETGPGESTGAPTSEESSTGEAADPTTGSSSGPGQDGDGDGGGKGGCGCDTGRRDGAPFLLVLLLAVVRRPRRL